MKPSKLEQKFATYWLAVNGPRLEKEYRFTMLRRWRFDFAHPASKVAIEVEGGVWSGGRHTTGAGFCKDCEKYNQATLDGWRVFRLTGQQITVEMLEKIKGMIL